ncbi:2,3-bisphosphoglycerate-dependent phosphoglycerate mutase [Rubripirellula lacrimiformis]|uniref:phosphoglycerate mutase (2,3-diphosphoglycerate-dependent) n=1 Tax=Rubripirellula lacrimiformis TaxID=1930273 RepID=A0A517NA51_9BACT|nr:histidine phosphatase family protein [Rubripirellula lacrimiformis]QDT04010.1 2,3-bisphosphoglycerate-dependent phosphoglycerate mutase [Rubripirellula lacrimiformis]
MVDRICILIRHGDYHQLADAPSAHQPFRLTDLGRRQAMDAAERVRQMADQHGWSLAAEIHSSSLLRAWETAQIAMQGLPDCQRIVETDRLAERCVGNVANLNKSEIAIAVDQDPRLDPLPPNWKSDSHFRLPFLGAESLMESGRRVADYLSETMARVVTPGEAILFFGHGASLRHAAHLLGVLSFERISKLSMHHAVPIAFSVSSDGLWQQVAGDWKHRSTQSQRMD